MEMDRLNGKDESGFHSKLSRTLYIGNLNEHISDTTLYKYFEEFGDIISISIKKKNYMSDCSLRVYAFIRYFEPSSVFLAMLKMNDVVVEGCHIRLGFGKSHQSKCVWVTGIKSLMENNFLLSYLADCGPIISCSIDQINERALVYFKEISDAETAINKMRDGYKNGLYFYGDYASFECEQKFAETFNKQKRKNYLSTGLENVDCQYLLTSDANEKNQLASNLYVESNSSYVHPTHKEHTSPIACVWINGIVDSVTNEYLESHFSQFGPIKKCLVDRWNQCALLCFQQELHAQTAVSIMNGNFIKGQLINVRIASIMCQACEESNINNNDLTILQHDNAAQSPSYSTHMVPYQDFRTTLPYCSYNIDNKTCPTSISDSYNNSINVNNSQYISQHNDFNTSNINISNYFSNTNPVDNIPTTMLYNECLPEISKSLAKYDNSVLSLPLPEFAKNIIPEEPTSPSIKYSLSSNSDINQATYMFNGRHDEKMNCSLDKTVKQDLKYDQNNNHSLKSKFKILESIVEESKRLQYVSNKDTPNQFIQSQSNPKFQNQQVNSSLKNKLSTSGSSKYHLGPSTAIIQTQYHLSSDTQPVIIPQNSKKPLIDSQFLPIDPMLLINPNYSLTSHTMISNSNVLSLEKQNICTINNCMHTYNALNTQLVNPIGDYPKYEDRSDKYFKIVGKIRYEYTKHWVNTNNWLTDTSNYDYIEQLDYPLLSDIREKENQRKLKIEQINKHKSLDGFIAKGSIESVHSISVDVKKSTNINKGITDNKVNEKSIAKMVSSSLIKNKQSKISSTETRDKIKSRNFNESASSISNNGNNNKNKSKKSVFYNHTTNEYKDHKSQSISSTRSRRYNKSHIKSNKTQDVVEKTNFNKYKNEDTSINKNEQCTWKKTIYISKQKNIKDYKHQILLGSKLIESKSNKSYYSTKSSLKRSISNTSVNHYNSKKWKTDNKTYKNNYTNTFEHRSPVLKPRKNIHNTWIPEKKNKNRQNSKSKWNSRID